MIGIGTTLHKFWLGGEAIYLPCLSYHLPSAEVRLFSPQTYHKLYGGHSSVFGDRVVKMIDNMSIEIDIGVAGGNVPMIHKSACTSKEIQESGPRMKPALQQYERKTDFMGSWSTSDFSFFKLGRWHQANSQQQHILWTKKCPGGREQKSLQPAERVVVVA